MADTVSGVAFAILAIATLGSAIGVIYARNVMHAAFWLLGVSLAGVGLYFLLEADYVAMVQLLVYAGAVAVLVIFTVMITMRRREDAIRSRDFSLPALGLALLFFGTVAFAITAWQPQAVPMPSATLTIVGLGKQLFSVEGYALPFEVASLVLTAALVAAIWWAREGDE